MGSDEDDGNNDIDFDIRTRNLFDPAAVEFTTFGQDAFAVNSEYPEEARTCLLYTSDAPTKA